MKRDSCVQVAVPVPESDVKLQRLAQGQGPMKAEAQQHPVGESAAAGVTPPRGRVGTLARRVRTGRRRTRRDRPGSTSSRPPRRRAHVGSARRPPRNRRMPRAASSATVSRRSISWVSAARDLRHIRRVRRTPEANPVSTSQSVTPAAPRNVRANSCRRARCDDPSNVAVDVARQSEQRARSAHARRIRAGCRTRSRSRRWARCSPR